MQKITVRSTLLAMLALTPFVSGAEDESFVNYDSIVAELRADADRPVPVSDGDLGWDEVAIHGGLGLATSIVQIDTASGVSGSGLLKGLELYFGMNLFTRKAKAEAAFRNFVREELDADLSAELKEFDLRVVFLPALRNRTLLRMGFGFSARYMDIDTRTPSGWRSWHESTPASILLLGIEHKLSKNVSLNPDISYRSAMTANTFDKSAFDASFRLNATF